MEAKKMKVQEEFNSKIIIIINNIKKIMIPEYFLKIKYRRFSKNKGLLKYSLFSLIHVQLIECL